MTNDEILSAKSILKAFKKNTHRQGTSEKFCSFLFESTTNKISVTCPDKQSWDMLLYCSSSVLVRKQERGFLLSYNHREPSIIYGSMGQGQPG